MNADTMSTSLENDISGTEDQYVGQYEDKFTSTLSWLERIKRIWRWVQKLRLWKILGDVVKGIGHVLFVSPPIQEQIEAMRVKAIQYRGIF